ncbi:MAG: helix-turn-helix transcriptional regulator [Acidobacteria bacterium]|nr:helix-turn-helix transcriptional regulator [Acidobacteriota bacterium]
MELSLVIKRRLKEIARDQRDLALAAHVTESYISQLLGGKKTPPAPLRTDVYHRMESFLGLPPGDLAKLADLHRREILRKRAADPPQPLFQDFRNLVLRKCNPATSRQLKAVFEKEPFGELERLVSQKLLDVAKVAAKEEVESEQWMRTVARLSGRTYEQMRVLILDFLDTDIFHVSLDNCVAFMDPLIDGWDIDMETFSMEIVLNRRLALGHMKRFEFVQREYESPYHIEPGFADFLKDSNFSGDITEEEIEFLKSLRFREKRPNALYYYRELQNLRDPLHFRPAPLPVEQ